MSASALRIRSNSSAWTTCSIRKSTPCRRGYDLVGSRAGSLVLLRMLYTIHALTTATETRHLSTTCLRPSRPWKESTPVAVSCYAGISIAGMDHIMPVVRSPNRSPRKILASSCAPPPWLPPSWNSRKILLYRPMSALLYSRSTTVINTVVSLNPPSCSLWSPCFTTGHMLQTVPVQPSGSCFLIKARPLTLSIIRYLSLRSVASTCRIAWKPGWLTFWHQPQTASLSGFQSPPEFLKGPSSALGFFCSWSMISSLQLSRGTIRLWFFYFFGWNLLKSWLFLYRRRREKIFSDLQNFGTRNSPSVFPYLVKLNDSGSYDGLREPIRKLENHYHELKIY